MHEHTYHHSSAKSKAHRNNTNGILAVLLPMNALAEVERADRKWPGNPMEDDGTHWARLLFVRGGANEITENVASLTVVHDRHDKGNPFTKESIEKAKELGIECHEVDADKAGLETPLWSWMADASERKIATKFIELIERLGTKPAFTYTSMADIYTSDYPPPEWLIEGLLPKEGAYILAGPPKAGKSWLALEMAIAVAANGGKVLYLGLEDTKARLHHRLHALLKDAEPLAGGLHNIQVATAFDTQARGKEAIKQLQADVEQHKPALVVVDTLQSIRGQSYKRDKNLYAEDYEALATLNSMAHTYKATFLILHHTRKFQAEDEGLNILGTSGITGAVDGYAVLRRQGENGKLTLVYRDFESTAYALAFLEGRWQVKGLYEEYALSETNRAILEAIYEANEPLRPSEVAELLDRPRNTIKQAMRRLAQDGLLTSNRGKYSLSERGLQHLSGYKDEQTNVTSVTVSNNNNNNNNLGGYKANNLLMYPLYPCNRPNRGSGYSGYIGGYKHVTAQHIEKAGDTRNGYSGYSGYSSTQRNISRGGDTNSEPPLWPSPELKERYQVTKLPPGEACLCGHKVWWWAKGSTIWQCEKCHPPVVEAWLEYDADAKRYSEEDNYPF